MNMGNVRLRAAALMGGAAIAATGLATAGSQSALALYTSSCSQSAVDQTAIIYQPVGAGITVYAGQGRTNAAGTTAAGVCLDNTQLGNGQTFGGDTEVGVGGGSHTGQAYAVVDGSDNNPTEGAGVIPGAPNGLGTKGYVGISNFETGDVDNQANDPGTSKCGNDGAATPAGDGSNSGGATNEKDLCATYFSLTGQQGLPLPLACGFTSSPDWDNTSRDGCFFP